nr:phage tail protein [Paenibacillus xylanexedens]
MLETMYPAAANSRQTELAAAINDTQTSFTVLDGSVLPPAPNQLTLGTDESAETILYTEKSGNEISGVTRGFEGVVKSWVAGTKLARYFTAYDHDTFRDNITDLDERLNNIPAPQDASLTEKGITQLSSATESDEEDEAATPKAVNTVRQLAVSQIGIWPNYRQRTRTTWLMRSTRFLRMSMRGKNLLKPPSSSKGER